VLQIAVAFQDLIKIVARLSHTVLELVHLVFDLLQMTKGCQRRFVYGRASFKVNVLGKQPQAHTARSDEVTAVGSFFAVEQTKDSGFAGAVAADESHVFAGIYLQRGATQNILSGVGFVNIIETEKHMA
jgi:hypothetical protein